MKTPVSFVNAATNDPKDLNKMKQQNIIYYHLIQNDEKR